MYENVVGIARFKGPLNTPNPYSNVDGIADSIHRAMLCAGLGQTNEDAPLKDIIQPGDSILLKPNWVYHYNHTGQGNEPLVTNLNFVESVLNEVCKAHPRKVIVADAPVQGCVFNRVVPAEWIKGVKDKYPFEIEVLDLRRTKLDGPRRTLSSRALMDQRQLGQYILFDLGELSMLEPVSCGNTKFRVTMYNPDLIESKHRKGKHEYLLSREVFDADVILNIPKLKTHQKAGMTGALKNIVGVNGNKEYLPHHRFGGSENGGDCYGGKPISKQLVEHLLDQANRNINKRRYAIFAAPARAIMHFMALFGLNTEIAGGWYGNDTVWRMVVDLNSLLLYGKKDGTIGNIPQRKIFSITDAIIAGDMNGPLEVERVSLGLVTFATSSAFADLAHTALMGLDWQKIPSVRESFGDLPLPLVHTGASKCRLILDGHEVPLSEIYKVAGIKFRPAPGWVGHIENAVNGH